MLRSRKLKARELGGGGRESSDIPYEDLESQASGEDRS